MLFTWPDHAKKTCVLLTTSSSDSDDTLQQSFGVQAPPPQKRWHSSSDSENTIQRITLLFRRCQLEVATTCHRTPYCPDYLPRSWSCGAQLCLTCWCAQSEKVCAPVQQSETATSPTLTIRIHSRGPKIRIRIRKNRWKHGQDSELSNVLFVPRGFFSESL